MTNREAWEVVKSSLQGFDIPGAAMPVYVVQEDEAYAFFKIFKTKHKRDYGCDGLAITTKGPTNRTIGYYKNIAVADPFCFLLQFEEKQKVDELEIGQRKIELQSALESSLKSERYEIAANIRDEAKRLGIKLNYDKL